MEVNSFIYNDYNCATIGQTHVWAIRLQIIGFFGGASYPPVRWTTSATQKEMLWKILFLFFLTVGVDAFDNEFVHAATIGDHAAIKKGIATEGFDINVQNRDGFTALMEAAHHGHIDIVRTLVKAKAKVDVRNNRLDTALTEAAAIGHSEIVQILLDAGANVNSRDQDGAIPLLFASMDGHEKTVEVLLANGAEVNARDYYGWTAILFAAKYGQSKEVSMLLKAGADVNIQKSGSGWTPLILATVENHVDVVQVLVENEATDFSIKGTKFQYTAMEHAIVNDNEDIIAILQSAEAKTIRQIAL